MIFHGLSIWITAEILFYIYYQWKRKSLNELRPHPPSTFILTKTERWVMLNRCAESIVDIKSFLSGWFLGARLEDLKRDNLLDFLAWAFFESDYQEMKVNAENYDKSTVKSANQKKNESENEAQLLIQEMDQMIDHFCGMFKLVIPRGRNKDVKCMRLNLDRIQTKHKPLFYYIILQILNSLFAIYLKQLGLVRVASKTESKSSSSSYFHTDKVSYWVYHSSTKHTAKSLEDVSPIVFVHGIGIGLVGYASFLNNLINKAKVAQRSVFLIEIPFVATTFYPLTSYYLENPPTMQEIANSISRILNFYGYSSKMKPTTSSLSPSAPDSPSKHIFNWSESEENSFHIMPSPYPHSSNNEVGVATLIGHSLGTGYVAGIIKKEPHLARKVILVDPICFLLFWPNVAYNFVYRLPETVMEWFVWNFASRECYITWTLGRVFHWHEHLLFIEDVPDYCELSIILGGSDCIVPGHDVRHYLSTHIPNHHIPSSPRSPGYTKARSAISTNLASPEKSSKLLLDFVDTMSHAGFMFVHMLERHVMYRIFEPHPNYSSYYEDIPEQELGDAAIDDGSLIHSLSEKPKIKIS